MNNLVVIITDTLTIKEPIDGSNWLNSYSNNGHRRKEIRNKTDDFTLPNVPGGTLDFSLALIRLIFYFLIM